MKEVDTLILGGRVLLMDEKDTILPAGAVAVDGERIAAVGPLEEIRGRFTGRMEMDARDSLVMPGLVNGHTHAAMHKHERGIDYYNCGAWIDEHPTYITVGEEGVQIHEYVDGPDGHHPGKDEDEDRRWDNSELAEFAGDAGRLEDGEYEPVGL